MRNSALAVAPAKSIAADPLSYLPVAISAMARCLRLALAAFWRLHDIQVSNVINRK